MPGSGSGSRGRAGAGRDVVSASVVAVESGAETATVASDHDSDDAAIGRACIDRGADLAQRVVRERIEFFGTVQPQYRNRIVDRQFDVAVAHSRLNRMPHA